MTYTIWGQYKECPPEQLDSHKDKQIAEEMVDGYKFHLAEWWSVWMKEEEE